MNQLLLPIFIFFLSQIFNIHINFFNASLSTSKKEEKIKQKKIESGISKNNNQKKYILIGFFPIDIETAKKL